MTADPLDQQHASMQIGWLLDVPFFDIPPNHLGHDLAKRLGRSDWRFHHSGIYQTIMFVARSMRRDQNGLCLPDRIQPGEVFLTFATSDNKGCACGGAAKVDELEAARVATIYMTARERRERLLELSRAICPHHQEPNAAALRDLAIECAGLLVEADEVDALRDVEKALPAFIILTRRERGRSAVRWRTVCTTLPGDWLGTKPPAGTA